MMLYQKFIIFSKNKSSILEKILALLLYNLDWYIVAAILSVYLIFYLNINFIHWLILNTL